MKKHAEKAADYFAAAMSKAAPNTPHIYPHWRAAKAAGDPRFAHTTEASAAAQEAEAKLTDAWRGIAAELTQAARHEIALAVACGEMSPLGAARLWQSWGL